MKILSSLLEVIGFAVIAVGMWMLAPWLGVVVGGASLVLVGFLIGYAPPDRGAGE